MLVPSLRAAWFLELYTTLTHYKMWDLRPRNRQKCFFCRALGSAKPWAPGPTKAKCLTLVATHVVPLVEVHGAGDGGEALVAVVVVRMQGGGYAKMTRGR